MSSLTIPDDLQLEINQKDALVQSIISGKKIYDTLIIKEIKDEFDEFFKTSKLWKKLGQSVTTVDCKWINADFFSCLEKCFTNVKTLHLDIDIDSSDVVPKIYFNLETLTTNEKMINYK